MKLVQIQMDDGAVSAAEKQALEIMDSVEALRKQILWLRKLASWSQDACGEETGMQAGFGLFERGQVDPADLSLGHFHALVLLARRLFDEIGGDHLPVVTAALIGPVQRDEEGLVEEDDDSPWLWTGFDGTIEEAVAEVGGFGDSTRLYIVHGDHMTLVGEAVDGRGILVARSIPVTSLDETDGQGLDNLLYQRGAVHGLLEDLDLAFGD